MKIAVAGAGSIGCYVGGMLADAGQDVQFLARPRIVQAVAQHGLSLTDYNGYSVTQSGLGIGGDASVAFQDADVILVCVKSSDTAAMAQTIKTHASKDVKIISLQNGVTNVETLRHALPDNAVFAAMVPFNVVPTGPAGFHRGTSGDILIEAGDLPDLSTPHLVWQSTDNITAIQWGKLLINLGNGLNALSDLPLLEMLQHRGWRKLMATQIQEARLILKQNGIVPAKTTAAPLGLLPHILRLPTPLFQRVAAQMLTIDPKARSSMWDDLTQRRKTEIDALQGVIIELGRKCGLPAPLNTTVRVLIKEAEAANAGPTGLTPDEIQSRLPS